MKCQYTFPVRGRLLVPHSHPVTLDGWLFEFLKEGERVIAFRVTVPYPDTHPLPLATPPSPGRPAHFEFQSPLFDEVVDVARSTFGLLAFHHACEIDASLAETKYIPESEAERQALPLYSIRMEPPSPIQVRVQYRLLLRALIAARTAAPYEHALAFLRLGQLALQQRRYIEALYHFFFVLESQFGQGKSRSRALERAFLSSPELVSTVEDLLKDPESLLATKGAEWARSARSVLAHFISIRGRLHHHSAASSKTWHPDSHQEYRLDCACLGELAISLMIRLAGAAMFTPATAKLVRELCPHEPGA